MNQFNFANVLVNFCQFETCFYKKHLSQNFIELKSSGIDTDKRSQKVSKTSKRGLILSKSVQQGYSMLYCHITSVRYAKVSNSGKPGAKTPFKALVTRLMTSSTVSIHVRRYPTLIIHALAFFDFNYPCFDVVDVNYPCFDIVRR